MVGSTLKRIAQTDRRACGVAKLKIVQALNDAEFPPFYHDQQLLPLTQFTQVPGSNFMIAVDNPPLGLENKID